ncbi:DegT/DnrJ/EryC1/StrS family aminotransferase [Xylophilus ampelinus]|uniref:dTDP-4-amino-4,6-dideoxygalactose transaminase n=1 Tax=Xylophilus ampelinus TaxID=54067 RepID=A0A318STH3_9BURK|nr:DegT/DnrJ/EryC1/StrS family aminotransferase [Xylophilus ampelinus]MCS4510500.1 DegT/DnrJ/EryC1/StrS family aminotransferase [Xylophilus ampelinus]PYE77956.1 dTDP-4-amino-4,6-dideoxygalactose transaminase [Xylophilus ampelinus]
MRFDVPPTAGLPLQAADLLPGGDDDLEAALARFLGAERAQLECSGTAALVVALTVLRECSPGRTEVVVPGYTCPLVALAVAHCGLRLRLCDLRPASLDLCPDALAALCGPRTLAVLPTHLAGRVADVGPALAIAHAAGAWVIEDAAQALGARSGGRPVGLWGDIGFYSLAVGKGLTIFEGGVLVARDPAMRDACRAASRATVPARPGWELRRSVELLGYAALYRPAGLRWAYGAPLRRALARGDWVEAAGDDFEDRIPLHRPGRWRRAVGVRALARLNAFLADGTARATARRARLATLPGITVLADSPTAPDAHGTWPAIWLLLPTPAARDAVLRRHWGAGCGLALPFVHALPDYPRYIHAVPRAGPQELPHARDIAARVLSVSNSAWLDEARFDQASAALAQACR